MRLYECRSQIDLKNRIEMDKSRESHEIGSRFLDSFRSNTVLITFFFFKFY